VLQVISKINIADYAKVFHPPWKFPQITCYYFR
jgi:hypothetical protein